jgi:2-haloacid dehalogenase
VLRSRGLKQSSVSAPTLTIETVVFDLGGVLVDWNPRYLYRQLIKDEKEIEKFLAEVCHSHWNEKQDAGRSFADGVEELLATHPQHENLIRAYFDRWSEMLGGAIQGTVEILEELHSEKRQRLFALSNWSAETFPYAKSRFEFLKLFENILVSGEEHLIKPDARFFALLSERYQVRADRTVFIDDVEKNVNAARALGFHAIQFTSPEDLRRNLTDLKVLSS